MAESERESERNRRIRDLAHDLWEREGRPEGRADAHWDMASEIVAQHDFAGDTLKPNPAQSPDDTAIREQPVEELGPAEAQGEVPGLADQGEDRQIPRRNRRVAQDG